MRSMVEGHVRVFPRVLVSEGGNNRLCPSTTFGGPPPRSGEEWHAAHHCRSRSRPTIIRITWLVPSRIEWTRRSRQNRSIG